MSFWTDFADSATRWVMGGGAVAALQVVVAAAVVYLVALWITRTGKKRYMGRNTVFDLVLAFILGSVLARAINGGAPLISTALAGFVLVAMHWGIGVLSVHTRRLGPLVKGEAEVIVQDGEVLSHAMADHHLTLHDLEEAVRQHGLSSVQDVEKAYFERNGRISVVAKSRLRVLEVDVEDGVQTVRVEIMG